ncbi:ankyrin repeat domain-containing protein, chloroplastic isoform X2 [Pistacia vera]|nr:ankyrin repeat domain-containing protein, chloroplastic isoform X2 [Pistacia vera]
MSVSLPTLLNPYCNPKLSYLLPHSFLSFSHKLSSSPQNFNFRTKRLYSLFPSESSSYLLQNHSLELEDRVIGDCLVFEEGVFEDPYLQNDASLSKNSDSDKPKRKNKKKSVEVEGENLVPEKWRQVQEEINLTKKDKRKIRQEMEFGSRVEKRKQGYVPLKSLNLQEYLDYKKAKLAQVKPVVLDNPQRFRDDKESEEDEANVNVSSSERLEPKNPKWAVYGRGLDDVSEFFNKNYEPPDKKSEGPRKLFTKEEKILLNKKIPDLVTSTSKKWLPLHTLAASGEFYLVDALLKHNVDINAVDKDGLTAIHKSIIGKKQAVTNYLLRESANPFVCDDDGWTPLHLAVQARRTDIVKLLLIKGADKTLKNQEGLTPLDLCLYSGEDTRTYELIKLLKQLPKRR